MLNFTVSGLDGRGASWEYTGKLENQNGPLDPNVLHKIGIQVFAWLTRGAATYGHPGEAGCTGPYQIERITIDARRFES